MSVPKWMEDVKKYGGSNIVPLLIGECKAKMSVSDSFSLLSL